MLPNVRTIHFIGIGGSGMSGLAQVYAQLGYTVTGSDLSSNEMTQRLTQMGVTIYTSHKAENCLSADLVIISSAIAKDNPERLEAAKRNIPVWHRSDLLLDLMSTRQVIAVAGTHGKTTTSSMIFSMLLSAGIQPTAIIGGRVTEISSGATLGEGPWLVAEADESDRSFLSYFPKIAVINNIEADHLENYNYDVQNIINAFREFAGKVPPDGTVIWGIDEPHSRQLSEEFDGNKLTFGFHPDARLHPVNVEYKNFFSYFDVYDGTTFLGHLEIHMPGKHNVLNALASVAVGIALGLSFDKISSGLETFAGVDRRFNLRERVNNILVIDDYAHNPAKVAAAIEGATTGDAKRVIAIFQPHRYSRTRSLAAEFAHSFDHADLTILTEIYPAGEKPEPGVTSQLIIDEVNQHGYQNMMYMPERGKINDYLMTIVEPGDLVMYLGAGDICKLADDLHQRLEDKYPDMTDLDNLLDLKGTVDEDVPLKRHTMIRVGGNADRLAVAESVEDLAKLSRYARKNKIPLFPMGAGSNLLISDKGIRGIVVKLGKGFAYQKSLGNGHFIFGAANWLPQLARLTAEWGYSGLEELAGIPATLGGAVWMNAGARGKSMGDLIQKIFAVTYEGEMRELSHQEIDFGYHHTNLSHLIIYEVELVLTEAPVAEVKKRIEQYLAQRNASQPTNMPSAGCMFRNPEVDSAGKWIDRAGLKGTKIGGAMISPKHANFFVNTGNATAEDFLKLIQFARDEVKKQFDVDLNLEVKIIGEEDSTETSRESRE